jgi:hypothetical protein
MNRPYAMLYGLCVFLLAVYPVDGSTASSWSIPWPGWGRVRSSSSRQCIFLVQAGTPCRESARAGHADADFAPGAQVRLHLSLGLARGRYRSLFKAVPNHPRLAKEMGA